MFKGLIEIFKAIRCALNEKTRQSKQFKQKQNEIYQEGLTEVKLSEQLFQILDEMYADDSIASVKIQVADTALPFLSDLLPKLHCEVISCAEATQFILLKNETYL